MKVVKEVMGKLQENYKMKYTDMKGKKSRIILL